MSHYRGRTGIAAAATGELHLGPQSSHLRLLKVGQRSEFGYRKQLVPPAGAAASRLACAAASALAPRWAGSDVRAVARSRKAAAAANRPCFGPAR